MSIKKRWVKLKQRLYSSLKEFLYESPSETELPKEKLTYRMIMNLYSVEDPRFPPGFIPEKNAFWFFRSEAPEGKSDHPSHLKYEPFWVREPYWPKWLGSMLNLLPETTEEFETLKDSFHPTLRKGKFKGTKKKYYLAWKGRDPKSHKYLEHLFETEDRDDPAARRRAIFLNKLTDDSREIMIRDMREILKGTLTKSQFLTSMPDVTYKYYISHSELNRALHRLSTDETSHNSKFRGYLL